MLWQKREPLFLYLKETTNYATFRQSNLCSTFYCSSYGYLSCSSWFRALHLSCLTTCHAQQEKPNSFPSNWGVKIHSSTKCLYPISARWGLVRYLLCFLHFALKSWCRVCNLVVERLASCCNSCYYVIETYELWNLFAISSGTFYLCCRTTCYYIVGKPQWQSVISPWHL